MTFRRRCLLALPLLPLGSGAEAQAVLSSPLPSGGGGGEPPAVTGPHGQGAGVHSPLSAFAPLARRNDVVAWSTLTDVTTRVEKQWVVPVYPGAVTALDRKQLRLQGFMLPLGPGENQRHFLLASVPLTCPFCTPGGPESLVEVRTRRPVKYRLEAVVVEGTFHVLRNDPYGLYYRLTEAVGVE